MNVSSAAFVVNMYGTMWYGVYGAEWVQRKGDELKLVYPQPGLLPDSITTGDFKYYLLQPMDGPLQRQNTRSAIAYCQANTKWRLSGQTHKILEIR